MVSIPATLMVIPILLAALALAALTVWLIVLAIRALQKYLRGGEGSAAGTPQSRGGLGRMSYRVTQKTGPVADVHAVSDEDDVLFICDDGTILRTAACDVSVQSRYSQGVRLMRTGEQARVIGATVTGREETVSEEGTAGDEPPAEPEA